MSVEIKVVGELHFDDVQALDEALSFENFSDESQAETFEFLLWEYVQQKGQTLTFAIHSSLSAKDNVDFQQWLEDLAELAAGGFIDAWQDEHGDAFFVRVHAGGAEETIEGPFPDL